MDERQSQSQEPGHAAAMQAAVRDEGRQFALPLVVRVERADPPTRTDALEAAARAGLEVLSDPRGAETDFEDPTPPGDAPDGVPVLWLNPELRMSTGKAMAQVGHGAQLASWELEPTVRSKWKDVEFDLRVRTAGVGQWKELLASGLPVVTDGGFTEVAPGAATGVADHPALRASLSP